MNLPRKHLAAICVTFTVLGIAVGRYSKRPETRVETKVETKVEVKYIDRVQYVEREVKKHATTTTTRKPDGEVTVVKVEDTHVQSADTTSSKESVASELRLEQKIVTKVERPNWNLNGAAFWTPGRLALKPSAWELGLNYRLAGPLLLGPRYLRVESTNYWGLGAQLEW